jgi:hypothetical protein
MWQRAGDPCPKERKRYWKFKEEALHRIVWRTRFERGCRLVVRLRDGDSKERLPLKTFTSQKLSAESAVHLLVNYCLEKPSFKELLCTE